MSAAALCLLAAVGLLPLERRVRVIGIGAAALAAMPTLAVGGLVLVGVVRRGRRRSRSGRHDRAGRGRVADFAEIMAIALAAGVSVEGSLSIAAAHSGPGLRSELDRLGRTARLVGLPSAIADHDGRLADLLTLVGQAIRTGAPLELLVRSYAAEMRSDLVAARIAGARRLPALLAIPLSLLILPGFVLMVMGPTVLTVVERLVAPLAGG